MAQPNGNFHPGADFLAALHKVRRPLLLSHVTPDADAIGSSVGLATALRDRDVNAVVGLPPATIAKKLNFMLDLAAHAPRVGELSASAGYDSIIVLDTAGEKRINIAPMPDFSGPIPILNIDHHITNTDFGRHNWVDPHATSTCELVARLLFHLGWTPSPAVASLLYAGIHGDTAGFSMPSTSADSLRAAAELVQAGADVSHIGEQLCRSQAKPDFELLRRVYDHTTVQDNGQIAYSYLTYEDFIESGSKAEDIDDQVSIPLGLRGVRIAMLFSEGERGIVRINLRGEGRVTVVELAQKFGGGGHTHAAGVRVRNKSIPDVIREVVAAAEEHLRSFQ